MHQTVLKASKDEVASGKIFFTMANLGSTRLDTVPPNQPEDQNEKAFEVEDTSVQNTSIASKSQQNSDMEKSTDTVNEVAEPERTIRGVKVC